MTTDDQIHCIAFEGYRQLARGPLSDVALEVKRATDRGVNAHVLVFEVETSAPVDVDLRGTIDDVAAWVERHNAITRQRAAANRAPMADENIESRKGPGRRKLGVVAREITLLPRHWEWLSEQPGGASVTLRRLVDEARASSAGRDRIRRAREYSYRFMSAIAGNLPDFEEATRALFAGDRARFERMIAEWPQDVRTHLLALATSAFDDTMQAGTGEQNIRSNSTITES